MYLDRFHTGTFTRGQPRWREALWMFLSAFLISAWYPGSRWRCVILRAFGAEIGQGVVIKPGVRVKFPWRLVIGDHCWIGESVWIDNPAMIRLGRHICLSQGAYLCSGSHDWTALGFDLHAQEIHIADHVWIGAFAKVPAGSAIAEGAVLTMSSRAAKILNPWTIYSGVPARAVKSRQIRL